MMYFTGKILVRLVRYILVSLATTFVIVCYTFTARSSFPGSSVYPIRYMSVGGQGRPQVNTPRDDNMQNVLTPIEVRDGNRHQGK